MPATTPSAASPVGAAIAAPAAATGGAATQERQEARDPVPRPDRPYLLLDSPSSLDHTSAGEVVSVSGQNTTRVMQGDQQDDRRAHQRAGLGPAHEPVHARGQVAGQGACRAGQCIPLLWGYHVDALTPKLRRMKPLAPIHPPPRQVAPARSTSECLGRASLDGLECRECSWRDWDESVCALDLVAPPVPWQHSVRINAPPAT